LGGRGAEPGPAQVAPDQPRGSPAQRPASRNRLARGSARAPSKATAFAARSSIIPSWVRAAICWFRFQPGRSPQYNPSTCRGRVLDRVGWPPGQRWRRPWWATRHRSAGLVPSWPPRRPFGSRTRRRERQAPACGSRVTARPPGTSGLFTGRGLHRGGAGM